MSQVSNANMSSLLARVQAAGIPLGFARGALPSWWDDAIAESPGGVQQAQLYLARAFNLDVVSLATPSAKVEFRSSQRKFKLSRSVGINDVSASAQYATAMAKIALSASPLPQAGVPRDAIALRNHCLSFASCVNLGSLLAWCASARIPVVHIEKLPGKKMYGLVVRDGDRYAIVLSRRGSASELLFWLAHEIGHIACEHLSADGFVADETINSALGGDADEKEADAYAIRLLNGQEIAYTNPGHCMFAGALATASLRHGNLHKVDPGHIALNYAFNKNRYPLGKAALKLLPDQADAEARINQAFFDSLDPDALSEDQFSLLARACSYRDIRQSGG